MLEHYLFGQLILRTLAQQLRLGLISELERVVSKERIGIGVVGRNDWVRIAIGQLGRPKLGLAKRHQPIEDALG